jgi:uncharacterized membrane protein YqaE (UPF0057 family)
MNALRIVLAVLLPPLAVFLHIGFRLHFFLNAGLTVLGYLPGVIHALYVVIAFRVIESDYELPEDDPPPVHPSSEHA